MLMALLFVAGVMNLAWVAAISVLVLLEKAAPFGRAIALASGSSDDRGRRRARDSLTDGSQAHLHDRALDPSDRGIPRAAVAARNRRSSPMCDRIHPRSDGRSSIRRNCSAPSNAPASSIDGSSRSAAGVIRRIRRHRIRRGRFPRFDPMRTMPTATIFARASTNSSHSPSIRRTAYMCSEGLWWRCHRRIISDHLVVRGWTVMHIMPTGKLAEHSLPELRAHRE